MRNNNDTRKVKSSTLLVYVKACGMTLSPIPWASPPLTGGIAASRVAEWHRPAPCGSRLEIELDPYTLRSTRPACVDNRTRFYF